MLTRFHIVTLAIVAVVVTGDAFQTPPPARQWPPAVQKISTSAPVLSPTEALATFSMPSGYRLELVASEPMIQDPVAIDWDASGRLWAIELPGYMRDMMSTGEYDATGRIVVLEDKNDDGIMDTRTVFADGLIQPRALKVLDRGALVGEPPNVWLLKDNDRDLHVDGKELVTTGYGRRETNVEVNANGLYWALDNRIYAAGIGVDMYFRWQGGRIETQKSLSRGQWGLTQDDAGRIYRNHNESVLHVDLIPTPYFARNPSLLRTRGSHEMLIDAGGEVNAVWPSRQTPGTNRAYQSGVLRADGTLAAFTAACAPTVYRGDRLPTDLQGNVFVAEPAANLVSRIILRDDATTLRARKGYDGGEFLTSTDERFRPVYLSSAPDGTLHVVDLYRGIIQHRAYITEYLRDQIKSRQLEQPIGLGRIYRVVHETTRRDARPRLSSATTTQLVETLSHPNGWRRDTAQQLLVQRGDRAAVAPLLKVAAGAKDWRTRLHALWTLDALNGVEPTLVTKALDDPVRDVRASALRIAERWLGQADHPIRAAVVKRTDDPDWTVRQQLAASLGALPTGAREPALVSLLERHAEDPIVLDTALSGLAGSEANVLQRVLESGTGQTPQRVATIAMLSATLVRSAREADIQNVFTWAADANRAPWMRDALLRGAEIALLGAPMPGSAPPRRSPAAAAAAAAPCATCPGGRAGPGGGYAYRRQEDIEADRAAEGPPRRNESSLRLEREPVALSQWAARPDDLAARVVKVLSRVSWPGKSGDGPAVPALTAAEQQRFDAGRGIYLNICQACHQPDGRGQERLAPTLIGSALTLATPEVPIRIVMNGKEGPIGLMPPIGFVLSDEQIASVLTYIRREWGQTGAPVDPAVVAKVRAVTGDRLRAWTDAELMKIISEQKEPR